MQTNNQLISETCNSGLFICRTALVWDEIWQVMVWALCENEISIRLPDQPFV